MPDTELVLVADIGGTNARFALADLDGAERPRLHDERKLTADRYASLQQAARHYLAEIGDRTKIKRAAIAVACPVIGDEIRLTNRAWSFNRRELEGELGLDELLVMNDFGAAAHAIPALRNDEKMIIHRGLHDGPRAPISVIGPGTGMGVALVAIGGDHLVAYPFVARALERRLEAGKRGVPGIVDRRIERAGISGRVLAGPGQGGDLDCRRGGLVWADPGNQRCCRDLRRCALDIRAFEECLNIEPATERYRALLPV